MTDITSINAGNEGEVFFRDNMEEATEGPMLIYFHQPIFFINYEDTLEKNILKFRFTQTVDPELQKRLEQLFKSQLENAQVERVQDTGVKV